MKTYDHPRRAMQKRSASPAIYGVIQEGAAVAKFPNIPRLTIVVPYDGQTDNDGQANIDERTSAFENSLVSVLQHRPDDCEILVPHSGDYDDPFDLGDEVRFVDAGSRRWLDLVASATQQSRGRFVHVVGDGHAVTANWTEAAISEFESHDCGCVIPVVRFSDGNDIAHAGWRRTIASACHLIAANDADVSPRQCRSVEGGFLSTSFWRRDLLLSLLGSYQGEDVIEASVVTGLLSAQAGWRSVVSRDCTLLAPEPSEHAPSDYESRIVDNHRRIQAIVDNFSGKGGWGKTLGRFAATFMQSGVSSALARATAPLATEAVGKLIVGEGVLRADRQAETYRLPESDRQPLHRAA